MAQEVDQASVDVIKLVLESDNGKKFFLEYLRENLKLNVQNNIGQVSVDVCFNNLVVTKLTMTSSFYASSF